MRMATTRWQFFVDWLGFGISGIHPRTLWHTVVTCAWGAASLFLGVQNANERWIQACWSLD